MRSSQLHMTKVRDPYAPIEKVPLLTPDGMKSRGYAVQIEDDSASVGLSKVGEVSEDYLLVPNRDVRTMAYQVIGLAKLRVSLWGTVIDGFLVHTEAKKQTGPPAAF